MCLDTNHRRPTGGQRGEYSTLHPLFLKHPRISQRLRCVAVLQKHLRPTMAAHDETMCLTRPITTPCDSEMRSSSTTMAPDTLLPSLPLVSMFPAAACTLDGVSRDSSSDPVIPRGETTSLSQPAIMISCGEKTSQPPPLTVSNDESMSRLRLTATPILETADPSHLEPRRRASSILSQPLAMVCSPGALLLTSVFLLVLTATSLVSALVSLAFLVAPWIVDVVSWVFKSIMSWVLDSVPRVFDSTSAAHPGPRVG